VEPGPIGIRLSSRFYKIIRVDYILHGNLTVLDIINCVTDAGRMVCDKRLRNGPPVRPSVRPSVGLPVASIDSKLMHRSIGAIGVQRISYILKI